MRDLATFWRLPRQVTSPGMELMFSTAFNYSGDISKLLQYKQSAANRIMHWLCSCQKDEDGEGAEGLIDGGLSTFAEQKLSIRRVCGKIYCFSFVGIKCLMLNSVFKNKMQTRLRNLNTRHMACILMQATVFNGHYALRAEKKA